MSHKYRRPSPKSGGFSAASSGRASEASAMFSSMDPRALERLADAAERLVDAMENATKVSPKASDKLTKALDAAQKKSEKAMSNIAKAVDEVYGDKVVNRKAKHFVDMQQSMYNAVIKSSVKANKVRSKLYDADLATYKKYISEQENDLSKSLPKRSELVRQFLFETDRAVAKAAMKSPFAGMFLGYRTFRKSTLGSPMAKVLEAPFKMMYKGFSKLGDNLKSMGKKIAATAGDIWSKVIHLGLEAFDAMKKVLFSNWFKEVQEKLVELRDMFMAAPGGEQALANWRAVRDAMVSAQQRYGSTADMSARLTEAVYANSNAYFSMTDNINALNAAWAAGVRDESRQIELMQDISVLARATGQSESDLAAALDVQRVQMRMTREEAFAGVMSMREYARAIAQGGFSHGVDTTTMLQDLTAYQDLITTLVQEGADPRALQASMMFTDQLAAMANVDSKALLDFSMRAGRVDSPLLMQLLGNPQEVQAMMVNNPLEFWRTLIDYYRRIETQGPEAMVAFKEALDQTGLGITTATLDMISQQEVVDQMPRAWDALTGSMLDYESAVSASNSATEENTTLFARARNTIEQFGNGIMVGGMRLGEVLDLFDAASSQFGSLMGWFDVVDRGMNFAFGPLAGIIQPLTTLVGGILSLGGVFGNFSDADFEEMGMFGQFLLGTRSTINEYWPQIKPVLESVWNGIKNFFAPGPGGERSMFKVMLDSGVEWVRTNGVQIARDLLGVATEMMDQLALAIEELGRPDAQGNTVGSALSNLFLTALQSAIPLIVAGIDVFVSLAKSIFDTLKNVLQNEEVRQSLKGLLEDLFSTLKILVSAAGSAVSDFGQTLIDVLSPVFKSVGHAIWLGIASSLDPNADYGLFGPIISGLFSGAWNELSRQDYLQGIGVTADQAHGAELAAMSAMGQGVGARLSGGEMNALSLIESGNQNLPANGAGARGYYQMLPDTARAMANQFASESRESMYGVGGERVSAAEVASGAVDVTALDRDSQRTLAEMYFQQNYEKAVELGIRTPVLAAFAAYNGGESILTSMANAGDFFTWANALRVGSPAAWIASSGWGTETVLYVLRAMEAMSTGNGPDASMNDVLFQKYLGWPRMPVPSDYGWSGDYFDGGASGVPAGNWAWNPPSEETWNVAEAMESAGSPTVYSPPEGLDAVLAAIGGAVVQYVPKIGLASGGVVLKEMTARLAEGDRPEVVQPLDELYAHQDENNAELIDAYRQQTDRIVASLDTLTRVLSENDLLPLLLGGASR